MGQESAQPRWRSAVNGIVSAAAGVGMAHLAAAATVPAASPVLAVGSVIIDAAPTPVKEWAVATFGTADKPILLTGIVVVLFALAGGIGLLAARRRWLGVVAVVGLAVLAAAATALRISGALALLPALVAAVVAAAFLLWLTTSAAPKTVDGSGPLSGPMVRAGRWRPARRGVLLGAPALVAVVGFGGGAAVTGWRERAAEPSALPLPVSEAGSLPPGGRPDVAGLAPFVTPNEDFYRVDIALTTPRIDASTWSLPINGLVDREIVLTYDDLLAMPLVERWITLSCVSNPVGGQYVSTARWLGVPLADLLARAGVQVGAEQLFARGADGFSCSVPLDVALDGRDALLAVGMNGEPLPFAHGFPARLIVPGLFGFVSAAKWLTGLTLSTYADDVAYWTERGWATQAPVLTQCRIEVPGPLEQVPAGEVTFAGMAWAQHRGIEQVEISIDGGTWQLAELAADAGDDLWRAWSFTWHSTGAGRHDVQVRATDGTGQLQPAERTDPFPDGARGWHSLAFVVGD